MVNTPQSSRVAGRMSRSLFPSVTNTHFPRQNYSASKTFTQSGESNVQLNKKTPASLWHYAIGAVVIVGGIWYISEKME
jgi:hypothetical protein